MWRKPGGGCGSCTLVVIVLAGLGAIGYFGWTELIKERIDPASTEAPLPGQSGTEMPEGEAAEQGRIAQEVEQCIASASALERDRRPEAVMSICREVIGRHPDSPQVEKLRAWLAEFALRDIRAALSMGKNLELNGEPQQARAAYQAVIRRHPDVPEISEVKERLSALGGNAPSAGE